MLTVIFEIKNTWDLMLLGGSENGSVLCWGSVVRVCQDGQPTDQQFPVATGVRLQPPPPGASVQLS